MRTILVDTTIQVTKEQLCDLPASNCIVTYTYKLPPMTSFVFVSTGNRIKGVVASLIII